MIEGTVAKTTMECQNNSATTGIFESHSESATEVCESIYHEYILIYAAARQTQSDTRAYA